MRRLDETPYNPSDRMGGRVGIQVSQAAAKKILDPM